MVADFVGTAYFNSNHSLVPPCSPLLPLEGRGERESGTYANISEVRTTLLTVLFPGKAAVTTDAATGEAVERPEGYEPPVLESV